MELIVNMKSVFQEVCVGNSNHVGDNMLFIYLYKEVGWNIRNHATTTTHLILFIEYGILKQNINFLWPAISAECFGAHYEFSQQFQNFLSFRTCRRESYGNFSTGLYIGHTLTLQ